MTTANVAKADQIKLKPMGEIKAPASINMLPALKPIESAVPELTLPSNGSSNGSVVTKKIKSCPELPPGKYRVRFKEWTPYSIRIRAFYEFFLPFLSVDLP